MFFTLRVTASLLRRGTQRTLPAPGDNCRPPSSSLDPAADWAPEFTNVSQPVVVGAPVTLGAQPGTNTNARLAIVHPEG